MMILNKDLHHITRRKEDIRMGENELRELFEREVVEVTEEDLAILKSIDFSLAKGGCGGGCTGL